MDDLDEGHDDIKDARSLRIGGQPAVRHFDSADEERRAAVAQARAWLELKKGPEQDESRYAPRDIALVVQTNAEAEELARALRAANMQAFIIRRSGDTGPKDAIRVATMHRVKGLEFPCVCVTGVERLLATGAPPPADLYDDWARAERARQDRNLLYVASTRARDALVLTSSGPRRPLLPATNSEG